MDWTRIKRHQSEADADKPAGVYTSLEDLIRIQFQAKDFSFKPTQPVSSILSGRYASRLRGRGLNFEELRGYLAGDDTRNMDWKVTARTRKPHIRVYTEEKDRSVLLVLDQRQNMFFGTRQRMKSVTAAEVAALAAWRAVDSGDRIGAVIFNDEQTVTIPPARSRSNVMNLLGSIVEFNHKLDIEQAFEPAPQSLNEALLRASHLARHDVLIILISDFFGVDKQTDERVTQMTQHNDIIGVLVYDPIRNNPPAQKLTVSDGSQQLELDLSQSERKERLKSVFAKEAATIQRRLRRLSAPLLEISNEGSTVNQIRKLLGVAPQS